MEFKEPFQIYTAASNLEAHMIVRMLAASGIDAYAEEDQSGVSLWALGTMTQFHQPHVWIDKSTAPVVADLIRQFEATKKRRARSADDDAQVEAECEECGEASEFPARLEGTVQTCPHCRASMDVGDMDWDEDFDEPPDE